MGYCSWDRCKQKFHKNCGFYNKSQTLHNDVVNNIGYGGDLDH